MTTLSPFVLRVCLGMRLWRICGTSPLPHPTSQSGYSMGGRVGERAGTASEMRSAAHFQTNSELVEAPFYLPRFRKKNGPSTSSGRTEFCRVRPSRRCRARRCRDMPVEGCRSNRSSVLLRRQEPRVSRHGACRPWLPACAGTRLFCWPPGIRKADAVTSSRRGRPRARPVPASRHWPGRRRGPWHCLRPAPPHWRRVRPPGRRRGPPAAAGWSPSS